MATSSLDGAAPVAALLLRAASTGPVVGRWWPGGSAVAAPVRGAVGLFSVVARCTTLQQAWRPLAPGIGQISAVAFSPDGKRLAVGGEDAPAPVLIDVGSGRVPGRMTGGHRGGVYSVAFDPKGQRLVTGGASDQQAIIWDIATGRPSRRLKHPTKEELEAVSVGWSPDGSTVATGGGQGKVILWRAADGEQLATLQADTSWILAIAFSPDSSLLAASGAGDRQVTLWDVASRRLLGRLPHPFFVCSVAFDPGGTTLATSAPDRKVRLWDIASLRPIGRAGFGGLGWDLGSGSHLVKDTAPLSSRCRRWSLVVRLEQPGGLGEPDLVTW